MIFSAWFLKLMMRLLLKPLSTLWQGLQRIEQILPMLKRSFKILTGCLLVIAGIIVTPLPIPFGIVMIIIGLSLLVTTVPQIRDWLKRRRTHYRETSGHLNAIKHKLPGFARKLIEDTDPEPRQTNDSQNDGQHVIPCPDAESQSRTHRPSRRNPR